jgi:catechol 2,3-dioxygenase-like lactoylglutathione lyase family enzyme
MISLAGIGHVELGAQDLERVAGHHRDVLGLVELERTSDAVYLGAGSRRPSVVVRSRAADGITRLAFELTAGQSLEEVRTHLANHGVRAVSKSDREPGIAEALEFEDPEGNRLQLHGSFGGGGAVPGAGEIRPEKLGHVCLRTVDVPALSAWYESVLGFRWSDWIGDFFVFLRCGPDHHTLNLLRGDRPGVMHHMAYQLGDWADIQPACDTLGSHGIDLVWGPGRHGAGHNIYTYHRDPGGHLVELFTQLDVMDEELGCFEPRPWHRDTPQRPKRWAPDDRSGANHWGIAPPEGFA